MNLLRSLIIALGILAGLVFATLCVASFAAPGFVEQIGKDLIRRQVEKTVHEKVNAIDDSFLAKKAGVFVKGYNEEAARAKAKLALGLDKKIAFVIAQMANLDCECRKKIEKSIHDGYLRAVKNASEAGERLETLIRTKYMQTTEKLLREFRIFTGSNAIIFAILVLVGSVKKKANVHLIPAAAVLMGAAGITAYLYLFNQNWLHTLVFSDYVGFAYVAYLTVAVALLSDLIFNRARITSKIFSHAMTAIGNVGVVLPC